MVSSIFTPNRRIDYYRKLSQALMPKEIRAFDPNIRNPYAQGTGTNIANVLQGLAQTYFAQDPLRKADRLETEQRAAQSQVLSRALSARSGRTGESQYGTREVPSAGDPVDTFLPSTIMRSQPYRISDDGQQIPGSDPLGPEVLKAAGTTPGLFGLQQEESRLIGEERSEKKRLNYATQMLAKAETDEDKEYWLSEIDAVSSVERGIESKIRMKEAVWDQEAAAKFDMNWAIDAKTGKSVTVSNFERSKNPSRYSKVPATQQTGPIPSWVGADYQKILEEIATSQSILNNNRIALEIVTETDLTTGAFTPIVTTFKGYLKSVGIEVEGLTPAEVLDSISKQYALLIRNPKSGLGLTGNTSDADLRFLRDAVIGLAKSNNANEALLIIDSAAQRRKMQAKGLQLKWISSHKHQGLIGYKASEAAEGLKAQALFTKDERSRLDELLEMNKQLPDPIKPPPGGTRGNVIKKWITPDRVD